ncbi:hypothetical protein J3459_010266 [Metarhizium acridum]|uniref:Uncharacterized protein n=1 Tax=Metarhizium acridum (strain CQMa 102) TaxID=655827 RepID=E9EI68_METAQ|nr:uncharacterized protein MAC_09566 [Metarhizium acridum CQMa 102]EFY84390.1 hypothetical protein MAC_09566 [Metarhizium acridum CQMa 102]KAG8422524.1 hypothetical protein J3459_010266 [Metarhizium acridum]KAG8425388.1 hypothetical protein J3458_002093 [Metarhizium acridum]
MNAANIQAQQALNAYGPVSSPHIFDRASSKKVFADMLGSRRPSPASTPAESRRASADSSAASNKDKKDKKDSKKVKLPTVVLPCFRFVN